MAELSGWTVHGLEHLVDVVARLRQIASRIRETHAWVAFVQTKQQPAAARVSLWRTRFQLASEQGAPEELVVSAREQLVEALVFLDKLEEARWEFQTTLLTLRDEFAQCQMELVRAWAVRRKAIPGPPIEPLPQGARDEDHRRVEEVARRTGRFLHPAEQGARQEPAEEAWSRALREMPWSREKTK